MSQQRQIAEADWKLWRRLREQALERFCLKVLDDAAKFKDGEGTAHDRYLKLFQLVKRRDRKLADIFNDSRRSNAFIQITIAANAKLITEEDLARFTQETQDVVALLSGLDG
jgi:hypothetical protein